MIMINYDVSLENVSTVSPGLVGQILYLKNWVHHKVIATSDRQLYAPQCFGCQKRVARKIIFHSFHKASKLQPWGFSWNGGVPITLSILTGFSMDFFTSQRFLGGYLHWWKTGYLSVPVRPWILWMFPTSARPWAPTGETYRSCGMMVLSIGYTMGFPVVFIHWVHVRMDMYVMDNMNHMNVIFTFWKTRCSGIYKHCGTKCVFWGVYHGGHGYHPQIGMMSWLLGWNPLWIDIFKATERES